MLRDLTIQNYRTFKDFQIDDLARVNLIVGMNNSGKTSLLEAIYLLVNQGNPRCLSELLDNRGEIIPLRHVTTLGETSDNNYQILHIFHGHQLSTEQNIYIQSQQESPRSLQINLSQKKILNHLDEAPPNVSNFELSFFYEPDIKLTVPVLDDGSIKAASLQGAKQSQTHLFSPTRICQFLTADRLAFDDMTELWDQITLTPEYDLVVTALQIIEPDVKGFSFTSRQTANSGIILKIAEQPHPIPLGSMGEGMIRLLALAMSAVTLEDGFLLVDDIEIGLHYEKQTDMWRLILQIAKRLNVQVFATTHSWDCICAFQEALADLEDNSLGKLYRLSMRNKKLRPVAYTGDDLAIAVRQSIEVR